MLRKNNYGESITIEIVEGGFILTYPILNSDEKDNDGWDCLQSTREVFMSPRLLNKKIKSVIDSLGLVADK